LPLLTVGNHALCAKSIGADELDFVASPKAQEPDTAALCTEPGIRYAGKTAERAEVCFTLTRDRSMWAEIGFRFVRVSGCPDETTGKTYLEGPELLPRRRRISVPGFTATIHGARASGTLEDSRICGKKTFQWSAREVVP
jgi:hypothetical protein